jgi:2-amino-4-hydroxy-6-hydroxymethyldihydropteridine diphosphokinase
MANQARASQAWIGLGANLHDRRKQLFSALKRLHESAGIRVCKVSSLYETQAVGGPADQPPYLNAAAELTCHLKPRQLLTIMQSVEDELGRTRVGRNHPRTIDLDLLLFNDEIMSDDDLILPHPRMHQRAFVLQPLTEIAPEMVHPTNQKTMSQLLEHLATSPANIVVPAIQWWTDPPSPDREPLISPNRSA